MWGPIWITNETSSGLAITLQTELVLDLHSRPGIGQQLRDDPSWLESVLVVAEETGRQNLRSMALALDPTRTQLGKQSTERSRAYHVAVVMDLAGRARCSVRP